MASFSDAVKKYGSTTAAFQALGYTKNEETENHTVFCENEGCNLAPFFEEHNHNIFGDRVGNKQEKLCACGDKITEYEGELSREKERVMVCSFELNGDRGNNATRDRKEELKRQKAELERELQRVNDELNNMRN